jgi:hypothetical protein
MLKESKPTKEAVFTMKLESELHAEFMAETRADDRPASQVVRELMREYVKRQRQARAYGAFLERKVEVARRSVSSAQGLSNDEVEEGWP